MWADNETDLDLLGFDELVDELLVALTTPALLPLTVGVLGDWGSGKSSLLKIARRELEAETDGDGICRYLCVDFSPWLYEDYEDVKTALMRQVLGACRERATTQDAQETVERLGRFARLLGRRSRAFGRVAVTAAPAVLPVALGMADLGMADPTASAVQGAAQAVAPLAADALKDDVDPDAETDEIRDLPAFREQFAKLIASLDGVDAVVVFVDDLDRCLPETVVDTFEAIRLFLNSQRTAYVVAASREIVESAIDSRYPELAGRTPTSPRPTGPVCASGSTTCWADRSGALNGSRPRSRTSPARRRRLKQLAQSSTSTSRCPIRARAQSPSPTALVEVCEGERSGAVAKCSDEFGFDITRVLVGRLLPRDKEVGGVGKLPDVSAAPMADGLASAVTPVLLEPLAEPPTAVTSSGCFADVDDLHVLNPGGPQLLARHGRVPALEPAGRVVRTELRSTHLGAHDHVHTWSCRHLACGQFSEPNKSDEACRLQLSSPRSHLESTYLASTRRLWPSGPVVVDAPPVTHRVAFAVGADLAGLAVDDEGRE